MKKIDSGHVDKVIVTNTLPLPKDASSKVEQVSIASMLTDVILAEHFRAQQVYQKKKIKVIKNLLKT